MIRITYTTAPAPRPKPRAGDRRTTKKHGLQIRVHQRSQGMMVMGGGHRYYLWEWRKPEELEANDLYLLTLEEREQVEAKRRAEAQRRVLASAGEVLMDDATYAQRERQLLTNPPKPPPGRMWCAGCSRLVLYRSGGVCPPCVNVRQGPGG